MTTEANGARQIQQVQPQSMAKWEPMGLAPRNFDELLRMSEYFASSLLIPKELRGKAADVAIITMKGLELGIAPTTAWAEIYVINGRTFLSSALRVSLVKESPLCEYWVVETSDAKTCTILTKRRGAPKEKRHSFTIEMAQTAGLLSNDNYRKFPNVMLMRRCSSQLADMEYPDVVRGIGTTDDDMLFEREVTGETIRINPAQGVSAPPPPSSPPPVKEAKAKKEKEKKGEPAAPRGPEVDSPPPPAPIAEEPPASAPVAAVSADEAPPHDPVTGEVSAPEDATWAEEKKQEEPPRDPLAIEVAAIRAVWQKAKAENDREMLQSTISRIKACPKDIQAVLRPEYSEISKSIR